jgi:hypothetical protein
MIVIKVVIFNDLTELIVDKITKLGTVLFKNLSSLLDDLSYQSESSFFLLKVDEIADGDSFINLIISFFEKRNDSTLVVRIQQTKHLNRKLFYLNVFRCIVVN